jgi:hypothetical protein
LSVAVVRLAGMTATVQVTIDCSDPARLAAFWAAALDYELQPPPEGFDSWPAALASWGVPESEWNSASAVVDPAGRGPRLYFQRVLEPKTGKNRVHLDVGLSAGTSAALDDRRAQVLAAVERLVVLGAVEGAQCTEMGSFWVVLQDPEGNEFCVM